MPPRQPKLALLAGVIVAAPMTVLAGLCYTFDVTAPYTWYVLLALGGLTAFVAAWFVHAVDAIIYASLLSAVCVFVLCLFVFGLEALIAMYYLAAGMFGAVVAGAILGLLVRAVFRGRFDSQDRVR